MILELQEKLNNLYVFVLGREQKIALCELESVLRRFGVCFDILSLLENIVIIKTNAGFSDQVSVVSLMQLLGGTVKIYEISNIQYPITNEISNNQYQIVQSQIVDKLLENKSNGTLNFGISDYSGIFKEKELKKIGVEIKQKARKTRPVRFIEGSGVELSSATSYHKIFKKGGEEFGFFRISNNQYPITNEIPNFKFQIPNNECHSELVEESQNHVSGEKYESGRQHSKDYSLLATNYLLGRLIATTNPDEWSERDYGKPAGDKFSGMMPPKLARMLVNLALDPKNSNTKILNSKQIQNPKSKIQNSLEFENLNLDIVSDLEFCASDLRPLVVDPFCGSGNILMEAKMLGCEVMGSDISAKAVEDTRANLNWLVQKSKIKSQSSTVSDCPERQSNGQNCNPKVNNKNILTIQSLLLAGSRQNAGQFNNNSVFKADATSFDFVSKLSTFNFNLSTPDIVIVTEPYLGKPKKVKVDRLQVTEEANELKNIYLNFFKNIASLKPDTYNLITICFVFPIIETSDAGEISLYNECVDELRQMGYNTTRTLRYGRDYQVIKREIVLLELDNQRIE